MTGNNDDSNTLGSATYHIDEWERLFDDAMKNLESLKDLVPVPHTTLLCAAVKRASHRFQHVQASLALTSGGEVKSNTTKENATDGNCDISKILNVKSVYDGGVSTLITHKSSPTILRAYPVQLSTWNGNYKWNVWLNPLGEAPIEELCISVERLGNYIFDEAISLRLIMKNGDEIIEERGFSISLDIPEQICHVQLPESLYAGIARENLLVSAFFQFSPIKYIRNNFANELAFKQSDRPHDRILVVEDTKFYVMSVYLATWSKYFDRLFFTDFKEKNQKEITLHEVDKSDFDLLMCLIHPNMFIQLKDDNVVRMLKMADRFEIPSVMAQCAKYLCNFDNCPKQSVVDRLELADSYRLIDLQVACIERIHAMDNRREYCVKMRHRLKKLSNETMVNVA